MKLDRARICQHADAEGKSSKVNIVEEISTYYSRPCSAVIYKGPCLPVPSKWMRGWSLLTCQDVDDEK
jgi:hypothetical protein